MIAESEGDLYLEAASRLKLGFRQLLSDGDLAVRGFSSTEWRRGALSSVVFLRGVNVGGHKAFRPSVLVRDLAALDVVSIGAAGTFVVRAPADSVAIRSSFLKCLPFDAKVMVCLGRDLAGLVKADPFAGSVARSADGQFISFLESRAKDLPELPLFAPAGKNWQVGVLSVQGLIIASVMRRVGGTLLYPNEVVERHFGVAATTRGWPTILKVFRTLGMDVGETTAPKRTTSRRSRLR